MNSKINVDSDGTAVVAVKLGSLDGRVLNRVVSVLGMLSVLVTTSPQALTADPHVREEYVLVAAEDGDERRFLAFPTIVDLGTEILISYKRGRTHGRDLGSELEMARLNPATGMVVSRETLYSNPHHIVMSGEWVRFPNGDLANYIDIQHNVKGEERVGMHAVRSEDGGRTFSNPERVGSVDGNEYGYAFDAISEGNVTWLLAMTWKYLTPGGADRTAGTPRRAVHVIRSEDNGRSWSFVKSLTEEFGNLDINESAFVRDEGGFLICSRGYDDRARLHLVDKDFNLIRQSDLTEKHEFVEGYVGRPRLFKRDGHTYLLGRNWTHASDRPTEPRPLGIARHRTGQQLSLFRIDVDELSASQHTLLDNAERKNVTDGYYAIPYFRSLGRLTVANVITYKAYDNAEPNIINLQFLWNELR